MLSPENRLSDEPEIDTTHAEEFVENFRSATNALPSRINIDPQSVEQGLAKLVLTLIEFIRRLLEKQAIRRMEGGDLSPEQLELKTQFGLEDEDLNIDLGPIGRLL